MPKSQLQTQFPLSETKKFWKKFYGSFLFSIVVILLGVGLSAVARIIGDADMEAVVFWLTAAFLSFALMYVACSYWYQWAYIKRYYYSADSDFLTIKKGVFTPAEIHVQYRKIQDVYVDQDLMDRIFGLYDVHVASATATSAMEAHIDGVEHDAAEGLKTYLLDSMRRSTIAPGPTTHAVAPLGTPIIEVSAPPPVAPQIVDPQKLSALQEVSRDRFPLTKEWYVGEVVKTLVGVAVGIPFWYYVIFLTTSKDGSTGINDVISAENQANLLLFFLCLMAAWFVWRFLKLALWVSHYRYSFGPDFITQKSGIISIAEKHIPYASVQNILVNQGLVDRMLGIADVEIENAATVVIGYNKGSPIEAPDGVTIEGLFMHEAQHLAELLRGALFSVRPQQTGL